MDVDPAVTQIKVNSSNKLEIIGYLTSICN